MKKQFVPYEIALKLKELGFDEPCFGGLFKKSKEYYHHYFENQEVCFKHFGESNSLVLAPLWQQVIDWFRNKHKLHITITSQSQESWQYHIQFPHDSLDKLWEEDFNSYEEAREAAILKAFELI